MLLLGQGEEPYESHWAHTSGEREAVVLQATSWGSDLDGLIAMARHGAGVVLAPDFCVEPILPSGQLTGAVRHEASPAALVDLLPGWRLLVGVETVQALTLPLPAGSETARALVRHVREALGSSS